MKIYWIDSDGWFDWEDSFKALENKLEWIDVSENEYVFYDEEGFLYDYKESKKGLNNFILIKSNIVNKDFSSIMLSYAEGSKIRANDLNRLREVRN